MKSGFPRRNTGRTLTLVLLSAAVAMAALPAAAIAQQSPGRSQRQGQPGATLRQGQAGPTLRVRPQGKAGRPARQRRVVRPTQQPPRGGILIPVGRLMRMINDGTIATAKQEPLRGLLKEYQTNMAQQRAKVNKGRRALSKVLETYPIDADAARKALDGMLNDQRVMFDVELASLEKVQKLLGADGWKQLRTPPKRPQRPERRPKPGGKARPPKAPKAPAQR